MDNPTQQLRVLTLNCWGLKFVAKERQQRLAAIAEWIGRSARANSTDSFASADDTVPLGGGGGAGAGAAGGGSGGYDVIALQEIWVRADFDLVAARAKEAGLRYSRFFYSGAIGSGLAILSRHPITSAFISPFSLNGHPLHFIEGDFFAGKSVAGVTLDVAGLGAVDVLNTHMYAPGGEGEGVEGAHRIAQAWELARIVGEKSERGRHVILTGDFNSQPHSIIIRLLLSLGQLHDAFLQTHPSPPSITSSAHRELSALDSMLTHGITCDSPLNTYSIPKLAKRGPRDETVIRGGKRLDYVFYRSPEGAAGVKLAAEEVKIVLTELVPGTNYSYSDHFGLEVVLSILPIEATQNFSGRPLLPPPERLAREDLSRAISNLHTALRHAESSSSNQLKLFIAALVLVPILMVTASFQPLKWLSWLWVLLAVATGAGGATMLYTGFVGGQWEQGALRNVIVEMESELEGFERPAYGEPHGQW